MVGVICNVPVRASAPDQAPVAVQVVAFVEFQESVALEPATMVVLLAVSETMGKETAATVIVADCEVVPPAPVQLSV